MSYSSGQAARATGKVKSTISRYIKSGKISATRNPDGSVMIDRVELHRVHPPRSQSNGAGNGTGTLPSNDSQPPATPVATRFGQREIEPLRQWLADSDSLVEDLRRRLDRATALLPTRGPSRSGWNGLSNRCAPCGASSWRGW